METDTSRLEPPQADARTTETIADIGDIAPVNCMANKSQSSERKCCSENGGCDLSSVTNDWSQSLQQDSEAGLGLESATSHEDMHSLSQLATPDDSQFGSKGSSLQDMGSYFSPRIPDHSSPMNDIALPQTPPTPITELREWPPESKVHDDTVASHAVAHGPGRTQAGSNSEQVEAPEPPELTWKESATQTVIGPSTTRATRPTSVPILTTKSTSKRRREGPDYPVYPDQSFAALQSQQHVKPFQPHPLRTRSSHPSQNSSFSSISSKHSRDFTMQSGARTTGNTPAQSPGLYSPAMPRGRPDDSTRTPTLHQSHLQTPTETHKLLKDIDPVSGRKLINDYELIEKLGSGQHGTVKLGKNLQTGDLVAVKIVRRFSKKLRLGRFGDPSDMIKKEVAILKKARHGNVVSLLEVIDDDEFEKVYLVLEYVTRGEIVWRKWTDKDVAVFEMNRVKREKAKQTDESLEREEVERFNETVPTRRAERHKALSKHKITSFWSLEHGGEPEEDRQKHGLQRERFPSSTSFSSDQLMTVVKLETPEEATPKQPEIPRSIPPHTQHAIPKPVATGPDIGEAMSDLKLGSPAQLEDSFYGGSDSKENGSDEALNTKLEEIFAAQTHWSEEEEEYQYVPCLTLSQALDAFRDTVLGLEYLHYQGIIHRDIKPANLLWTSDFRVKISDFGVSYLGKPMREDHEHAEIPEADAAIQNEAIELAKTVGTPAFYAPELCDPELFDLEKNPHRPQITGQIDVWALGVTLYCMIFGRLPFIDQNEMAMYEKIAREDVFISKLRLKGVEKSDDKVTTNSHKRLEDVVEYEAVDDELRDLLRRLLEKNPLKRISLKEVKNHPWVLRGIQDQGAWVDETDPSVQSEGKKIEVSNEDVQYAVVGLVDRLKSAFRRVGSVVRGREGRKRTDSGAKAPDSPSSAPLSKPSASQDGRRSSLRGDEFPTALRASREGSEHPLSQSVSASPEVKTGSSYFGGEDQEINQALFETSSTARPLLPERTLSNAESTRTIRPAVPLGGRQDTSSPPFSSLTTVVDDSSSSSLGGIFGGAGRRFVNSMRSRERERRRDSPSQSSRSSSAGGTSLGMEDPHASPSIAMSSAVAAGRVDQPPVLREPSPAPPLSAPRNTRSSRTGSSTDAYEQALEQNYRRQILEASQEDQSYPDMGASAADTPCPPSPDDAFFSNVGISSSSDQVGSAISESFSHPSVPSIVSGASSVSGSTDVYAFTTREKEPPPSVAVPRNVSNDSQVDEAGYNGEGEQDSDSDEDMLVMGGKK